MQPHPILPTPSSHPRSNGPGDPSAVPYAVESIKALVGKAPVLGICMGHQLLAQALGGSTFKMKFGHHGGNHPVRQVSTGRVEISAQNHNYAVDPATLPEGVEVTHINLNDGTCAGLSFPAMNAMSIQYHPESSPGPHDSDPGGKGGMCGGSHVGVVERVCGSASKMKGKFGFVVLATRFTGGGCGVVLVGLVRDAGVRSWEIGEEWLALGWE